MSHSSSSSSSSSSSRLFERNRALGYVSNHVPVVTRYIQRRKENLIVTCTGRNFHTYGYSHFSLLSVSPAHEEDIGCLAADTYHIYTASGSSVYAWRRGNELKHTYRGHRSRVHLLLPFGPHLVSIDEESHLKVWHVKTEALAAETRFNDKLFMISALLHPVTYINKILLASEQGSMQLWNIKAMRMIYAFAGWNCKISVLEQAPAPDVVAVGLLDGRIILHNLKLDQSVFELVQDWGLVTAIAFRTDFDDADNHIMATGTTQGHIVLWNLDKRKVESQILNAHFGHVTGLSCLPQEPLLVSSSPDNTLKLWIFDLADGAGRLLKIREGHAEPPTAIRFYGDDGHNILSISGDSSLRIFSTQTETFNKSLGRASHNRKASKKKGRLVEDPLIMPPMTEIAAERTREKDWDNIVTTHHGLGVVTTWSYDKLKMGEHKLLPDKFKFNMNVTATTVSITQCGNFAIVGYNSGHMERFNIQSGLHRASYGDDKGAHSGPVKGVIADALNTVVVSAGRDGTVKFWAFKQVTGLDKKPKTVVNVEESVEWMRFHKENSLIAVALQDFSIILMDIDSRKIVRKFEGHRGQLTDASFSPDSRWLVSAAMDRTIRVWDIPSSQLIDIFQVPDACTSLTFSPTGQFLATTHVCNLGIYLWSNRTLYSHVSLKAVQDNDRIPLISLPNSSKDQVHDNKEEVELMAIDDDDDDDEVEIKDEDSNDDTLPNQLNSKLITMSALATSRWLNLLNIDIVKKHNKPKEPLKAPDAAPFFLPTVAGLQTRFDFSDVQTREDNGKLLPHPDFSSATPFGKLLEQSIKSDDFAPAFEKLKSMGPSAIDCEVQQLAFDVRNAVPMMLQFMKMLRFMLKSKKDFELAQTYLSLFLKSHTTMIAEEKQLAEFLDEFQKSQLKSWKVLREKIFYSLSVVQHIKRT